jgi:hypothetical protein
VPRRALAAALLLLLPLRAHAEQLSLDSSWELGGPLALRGALELEGTRLFWGCGDCAKALGDLDGASFRFGVSTPWLRAGHLSRAGLLRVAYNPLGFSPQSDVFFEQTGLPLERSLDGGRPGLLLMPLKDVLGLYYMDEGQGAAAYGCFASILSSEGSGVEGFVTFSQPDAQGSGEEWFSSRAPFPGGKLLVAGTRCRISVPGAALSAAVGTSRGGRAGPGGFWQVRGSLLGTGAYATLLVSGMDGLYRTPRGTGFEEAQCFAAAGGISNPSGSASVRYSLTIDQPAPVPHPCRATREELAARIERILARANGIEIAGNLKLDKKVSHDEEGTRQDSSRYAVALRASGRGAEALGGIELLEPDGLAVFLTGIIRGRGRAPHLTLDSRWEARLRESPELTELLTVRLPGPAKSFRVQAGIQGMPLDGTSANLGECVRLKVSWSVSASPVPGHDDFALQ